QRHDVPSVFRRRHKRNVDKTWKQFLPTRFISPELKSSVRFSDGERCPRVEKASRRNGVGPGTLQTLEVPKGIQSCLACDLWIRASSGLMRLLSHPNQAEPVSG